jgi:hypothetical protein
LSKPLTFVIDVAVRKGPEMETYARLADRLKRHGRVEMTVSSICQRSVADIPPGGSSWHDYTSWLPSLEKFFPHKSMVPFLDAKHIAGNRKLMRDSLAVIRKHKMGAAVNFHAPWYLPEAFFAKYPHLRGPRIDHPRRTRAEAYALCADLPENLDIFADMFGQMAREIPELGTATVWSNDAGGGFCWADWLYSGPNGPDHCKNRDTGERVRGLIDAFRKGAGRDDIDFDVTANLTDREHHSLAHVEDDFFQARSQVAVNSGQIIFRNRSNPALGLFDPVALVNALERMQNTPIHKIVLDVRCNYERGVERPDVVDKVIDIVDSYIAQPANGVAQRVQFLRRMCVKWVGEKQADFLLETLYDLNAAWTFRADVLPFFTTNYAGVSMRFINRPLVALPERLSPEEEAYWLPYVFNPSLHEARIDYNDFHGGRMVAIEDWDVGSPKVPDVGTLYKRLIGIADRLDTLKGDEAAIFHRLGNAVRICASIFRSTGNFYSVQRIRDRHRELFAGPPVTPPKVASWIGDQDLQYLVEFMRDELDNTTTLLKVLEHGGMSQILTAKDPADEDNFLLGPDLVNQLHQKLAIMRRHWLDSEQYLASPHK